MAPIITLTTDFGLADSYVAAMKGVILGINPEARLIDITHSIPPQNILQAAFLLSTIYEFFPRGTIHLTVVDPGVGTKRRAVLLRTPLADFITPDNGVLSYIIQQHSTRLGPATPGQRELEPGLEAVVLTRDEFWRSPVSPTFHGRDILAPVAAHLSLGRPITDFGEAITSLTVLPLPRPFQSSDGALVGCVLHVDKFGNLVTNIRADDLPRMDRHLIIEIGGEAISGLSGTYGEGEGLVALIGSSGYLEVAVKDGSASASLHVDVGDRVQIRLKPKGGG